MEGGKKDTREEIRGKAAKFKSHLKPNTVEAS